MATTDSLSLIWQSRDEAARAIGALSTWAGATGTQGQLAFALAHTAAIVLCFPATILFELAAGFIFGPWVGSGLAFTTKVVAACLTFSVSSFLSPRLERLGVAQSVEQALVAQPRLRAVADSVQERGFRFTVLARLSPVPSYLVNYGSALAGVPFADYAQGTLIATLPAVVLHVYSGSSAASLLATTASPGVDAALGALAVVGSALLLQQLLLIITEAGGVPDEADDQ